LSYNNEEEQREQRALVFNTFVWMQIFNEFNNRRLDNKFNIFEGVQRNSFFIVINTIMIAGQVMIIFVGGRAFNVTRLSGAHWGLSLGLGAISIPVGILIRLIPDEFVAKLIPEWVKRKAAPKVTITDEEEGTGDEFNKALQEIKEELFFIKRFKGGRMNQFKFAVKHPREALLHSRSPSRSRSSMSLPQTPVGEHSDTEAPGTPSLSPATPSRRRGRSRSNSAFAGVAAAGIMAGSIGGWSPIERGHGEEDSLKYGRTRSRSDLSREPGADIHPNTHAKDPIVVHDPLEAASHHPPSQAVETTPAFGTGPFGDQPDMSKNTSSS